MILSASKQFFGLFRNLLNRAEILRAGPLENLIQVGGEQVGQFKQAAEAVAHF